MVADVQSMCAVDICVLYVFVLIGNSGTILLLFLKAHVDRPVNPSLQCYSVLNDILVKNELCIPLERGSNFLSTGESLICLSPLSKLKIAVLFCSIYKKTISFSAIVFLVSFIQWSMMIMSCDWVSSVS